MLTAHHPYTHLDQAGDSAAEAVEAIQRAHAAADPVAQLLLLPLIAEQARIAQALAAIVAAVNARPE